MLLGGDPLVYLDVEHDDVVFDVVERVLIRADEMRQERTRSLVEALGVTVAHNVARLLGG